jgi:Flp pilus assembly protein TadG
MTPAISDSMRGRRAKARRGNAIVEAALGLAAFLMVLCGLMDFGRLNWERNVLAHAAREGVRYAIVRGRSSGSAASEYAVARVVKAQAVGLNPDSLAVRATWIPDNRPGSTVQVEVNYPFSPIMPFIPLGNIALKSNSRMVISQ